MMKAASRRVATVEEFYSILEQVHSKDCMSTCGLKNDICQLRFARFFNVPYAYMHAGDSNCLGSIFVLSRMFLEAKCARAFH